jgi:hypothetical protein
VLDLEEVRERRRKDEQQLPRQQQQNKEYDEVAKLKSEDDGSKSRSVAAAPALPERIQKPEGDSSPDDQCRKEEGGAAAGAGGTTRTRSLLLLLPLTQRSRSMITKILTVARIFGGVRESKARKGDIRVCTTCLYIATFRYNPCKCI